MSGKRLPGRYAALRKSVIPALFLSVSTMPNGPRNRDLKLTGIHGRVGRTAPVSRQGAKLRLRRELDACTGVSAGDTKTSLRSPEFVSPWDTRRQLGKT